MDSVRPTHRIACHDDSILHRLDLALRDRICSLMLHASPTTQTIFGYLSTVQSLEHGFFGGYLIISTLGRPLEFHCTAPVRPSRAQEILYGPALQPYLLGDQIGGTLLAAAKLKPGLILVDQFAALHARSKAGVPIVMVRLREENAVSDLNDRDEFSSLSVPHEFSAYGFDLLLPVAYAADEAAVIRLLNSLASEVDLAEPFGRIHEAVREAQRLGTRGNDIHGQAA